MSRPIVIYHNPGCGTSLNALALIRHAGFEPHVIDYQLCPPEKPLLAEMIRQAGLSVRDALRIKGTPYQELGLDDPDLSDDTLLDAMLAHPILINRPLVVSERGTALCRPSDLVLDLLPDGPRTDFIKDNGEEILQNREVSGADHDLVRTLEEAGLPTIDLAEPDRWFVSFSHLSGAIVGYGGLEVYGEHALLRSLVVLPGARGKGHGKAMVALLARRAFDRGARRLWLLTRGAEAYFSRMGFIVTSREDAPEVILATREAQNLCPSSAVMLQKVLRL